MALNKSIENRQGNTSSYHRISQIIRDRSNHIKVIVESYKDKASRVANKECMSQSMHSVEDINLELAILSQLYTKLKELEEFSGASDE